MVKFAYWYNKSMSCIKCNFRFDATSCPTCLHPGQTLAPVAPLAQIPPGGPCRTHAAWVKGQKEVAVLMLLTMDLDIQRNLAHLGAYDMLQELKAMFSKQAEQELMQTVREFHTCKLGKLVADFQFEDGEDHSPPPKKDNPAKDAICHQCGEVGQDGEGKCPVVSRGRGCRKLKPWGLSLIVWALVIVQPLKQLAKINFDSSLLWHCRLGHISKKRIESSGNIMDFLNSIDIESLGKCVSCLSGKMARKPYSHQVEKAKDLLGLIHTDCLETFKYSSKGSSKQTREDLFNLTSAVRGVLCCLNFGSGMQVECEDLVSRTRRPTDRLCLYIDTKEHELGDLGEPANYRAALMDPESKKWLDAMNVEMQSMKDNDVWVLVELPPYEEPW
ncbi:zinc finger, CCHC-type containing protein [Tanacetum coccineum]